MLLMVVFPDTGTLDDDVLILLTKTDGSCNVALFRSSSRVIMAVRSGTSPGASPRPCGLTLPTMALGSGAWPDLFAAGVAYFQ